MFSRFFIITLITAVTGHFLYNTPMCQDFLCWNTNKPSSPPVNYPLVTYSPDTYPPVTYPPVPPPMPTPVLYTDNMIPPYYGPGPYSPPVSYPPLSYPPVSYPPVSYPTIPSMPTPAPYQNNMIQPYYNPGPYSPPVSYPPLSYPPVSYPPVSYPTIPSMPTPAPYQNNMIQPYYNPGPYSPPVSYPPLSYPPVSYPPVSYPTIPSMPTPAPYQNNMIQPYYNPATYNFPDPWYYSAPSRHGGGHTPVAIIEKPPEMTNVDKNSVPKWLLYSLVWPGWEVLSPEIKDDLISLKVVLENKTKFAQGWETKLKQLFDTDSDLKAILHKVKFTLDTCKCTESLGKWLEETEKLSPKFAIYFHEWLKNLEKKHTNDWSHLEEIWDKTPKYPPQYQQYNPASYPDPYHPYYPAYMSNNLYMQTANHNYMNWLASAAYSSMMYDSMYSSNYPNTYPAPNQHFQQQEPTSDSYFPFFDTPPKIVQKPAEIAVKNSNIKANNSQKVTVIFDLREYNVSKCKMTVTMERRATIEELLTKGAVTNTCFIYTTSYVINTSYNVSPPSNGVNNRRQNGKYVDKINGISTTYITRWVISVKNGQTDTNLDMHPRNGDYIIINNTNI